MTFNKKNGFYDCPTCGQKSRKREDYQVCWSCLQQYNEAAGEAIASGQAYFTLDGWMLPRIKNVLEAKKMELEIKQKKYQSLQKQVRHDAYREICDTLKEKRVHPQVFAKALQVKSREFWNNREGYRLHAEMKILEGLISFLKGSLEEVQKRIDSSQSETVNFA